MPYTYPIAGVSPLARYTLVISNEDTGHVLRLGCTKTVHCQECDLSIRKDDAEAGHTLCEVCRRRNVYPTEAAANEVAFPGEKAVPYHMGGWLLPS